MKHCFIFCYVTTLELLCQEADLLFCRRREDAVSFAKAEEPLPNSLTPRFRRNQNRTIAIGIQDQHMARRFHDHS